MEQNWRLPSSSSSSTTNTANMSVKEVLSALQVEADSTPGLQQQVQEALRIESRASQEVSLDAANARKHTDFLAPGTLVAMHKPSLGSFTKQTATKTNLQFTGPHEIIKPSRRCSDIYLIKKFHSGRLQWVSRDKLQRLDAKVNTYPSPPLSWKPQVPRTTRDLSPAVGHMVILWTLPAADRTKWSCDSDFFVARIIDIATTNPTTLQVHIFGGNRNGNPSWANPFTSTYHQGYWINESNQQNSSTLFFTNNPWPALRPMTTTVAIDHLMPIAPFTLTTGHRLRRDTKTLIHRFIDGRPNRTITQPVRRSSRTSRPSRRALDGKESS